MARWRTGRSRGSARSLADRRTPLIGARVTRRVAAVAVLAAAATAVLGWRYAGDTDGGRADRELTGLLHLPQGVPRVVGAGFTTLGGPGPVVVALLVLAPLAWRLRGGRGLALVLVGPPTAMVTTTLVLKPLIERTRGGELAFPSGHATSVTSLALTTGVLVLGLTTVPRIVRRASVAGLTGLVLAVCTSLVGRNIHYPTDTLGAVGVSVSVVLATALVVDAWADLLADPGHDAPPGETQERPTDVLPRVRGAAPA